MLTYGYVSLGGYFQNGSGVGKKVGPTLGYLLCGSSDVAVPIVRAGVGEGLASFPGFSRGGECGFSHTSMCKSFTWILGKLLACSV